MSHNEKLLRYGELAALKARDEAKPEDIAEMLQILTDLHLTEMEAIDLVEKLIKKNY